MNQYEIERKSLELAKDFYTSGADKQVVPGTTASLLTIHAHIFRNLYEHAGQVRKLNLSKGNFRFASAMYLYDILKTIDKMSDSTFEEIIAKYVEINGAHSFMEGNDRSGRIWLDLLLRDRLGMVVGWSKVEKGRYLSAMERSPVNDLEIRCLLKEVLTSDCGNRQIISKGLEHSYYYEGLEKPK